ncbi:hypothetical protein EAS56_28035 [Bradyrhizobium guangzhouense]|uniref:BRCT domain-containing protein n=1 Tax=Bradyrhizobium guangzhouense TaxID=1325095 RepID=A0ABY0DZA0_9BRAD|nr:hypothetical protein [Bradyrhizobium guangzhouense]RXH08763.1 hypothetical protein EAS56_28035 [Bradyrhizobium guangzhouense]
MTGGLLTTAQDIGASSVSEDTVREVLAAGAARELVTVEWVKQTIRRDKNSCKMETDHSQSIEIAAMIAEMLDVRHCRHLQAFLQERPSARQFMADLADRAAAKIRGSRTGDARDPQPAGAMIRHSNGETPGSPRGRTVDFSFVI